MNAVGNVTGWLMLTAQEGVHMMAYLQCGKTCKMRQSNTTNSFRS